MLSSIQLLGIIYKSPSFKTGYFMKYVRWSNNFLRDGAPLIASLLLPEFKLIGIGLSFYYLCRAYVISAATLVSWLHSIQCLLVLYNLKYKSYVRRAKTCSLEGVPEFSEIVSKQDIAWFTKRTTILNILWCSLFQNNRKRLPV